MEHNMILSASGWRKIFAESGNSEDTTPLIGNENTALSALIAEAFAQYITATVNKASPVIAVARDSRPTGKAIADAVLRVLQVYHINVQYLGIAPAPEIMVYARSLDGFLYISASHNPIGYNGIKFGLDDGGVLEASENEKIISAFQKSVGKADAAEHAQQLLDSANETELELTYTISDQHKRESLWAYEDFMRTVITDSQEAHTQDAIFDVIKKYFAEHPLSLVCDMNGSSRTQSIDDKFFTRCGIIFMPFYNDPNHIAHAILPEDENLEWCAAVMTDLQADKDKTALLGYMPDCDGDRGNVVYWHEDELEARPISAQEVFALSVLAESTFAIWKNRNFPKKGLLARAESKYGKQAVVVNCPTSMRIDEMCRLLGQHIFRAEVGEANVVNLARQKRNEGYTVRILGEGSNGGNITWPSCVRDPIATVMALIKLLAIRDSSKDGVVNKGLFHLWCELSGQEFRYKNNFTLEDILSSLPAYTTTGVSEARAILTVQAKDKGALKEAYKDIFEEEWQSHQAEMESIYGITDYEVVLTNGTTETVLDKNQNASWNNANGGLKIRFLDQKSNPIAFLWMRPSGTEPVLRILCDVKGAEDAAERSLLRWHSSMLKKADAKVTGTTA